MEKRIRTWGTVAGGLLIIAACCPLLSKNGISVNAFQVDLGLKSGFVILPIGLAIAGLSWLKQTWTLRLSICLATVAVAIAFNYCWQGHHLNAVTWGTWLLLLTALHSLVFAGFHMLSRKT